MLRVYACLFQFFLFPASTELHAWLLAPFQDFLSYRMAKQAAGVMKDRGWDNSKALLVIASDVGEVGAG